MPLISQGLGGVAATKDHVIVSDRDLNDTTDVFHCFDASTGKELWTFRYPAAGTLDYGNSPRATPLILDDRAVLFGAFGHLNCVGLKSGLPLWQLDVRSEFDVTAKMAWGLCGSPLVVAGRVIVNSGGKRASLAAFDPETGEVAWRAPGRPAGYGSFVAAELGGRLQLVGHDATTLGGWDATTGKRLWALAPEFPNDFNVATPVIADGRVIVSTENNGTRMYGIAPDGKIEKQPLAACPELAPDTISPVVIGNRLFGVCQGLYCLDLREGLKTIWKGEDKAFESHTSLFAGEREVLVFSSTGELLLIDALADGYKVLSRLKLVPEAHDLLAHPALVGDKLYVRTHDEVICVSLAP
jgi:outer membrane protein assembly factor BamB